MTGKQKLLIANVALLIVAGLAVWYLLRSGSAASPSVSLAAGHERADRRA